ncbi:MAG: hypothetical protein U9Q23_04640, partial [Candidatus Bipolaricaulota bacterium]|nr:hypothetical protein [Candidatus Bipolaricaulota bacterium]
SGECFYFIGEEISAIGCLGLLAAEKSGADYWPTVGNILPSGHFFGSFCSYRQSCYPIMISICGMIGGEISR